MNIIYCNYVYTLCFCVTSIYFITLLYDWLVLNVQIMRITKTQLFINYNIYV